MHNLFEDSNVIDYTPNVYYLFEPVKNKDGNIPPQIEYDVNTANSILESMHVSKRVNGGDKLKPVWVLTLFDGAYQIEVPHADIFDIVKIFRLFLATGVNTFPDSFLSKNSPYKFQWLKCVAEFATMKELPVERIADDMDVTADTLLSIVCKQPIADYETWENGEGGLCATLHMYHSTECLAIRGTDIKKILTGAKIMVDSATVACRLHDRKQKINKTVQIRRGGPRVWLFPVSALEAYGFSVENSRKITMEGKKVADTEDFFNADGGENGGVL